jgi:hypothetical protein
MRNFYFYIKFVTPPLPHSRLLPLQNKKCIGVALRYYLSIFFPPPLGQRTGLAITLITSIGGKHKVGVVRQPFPHS